LGVMRCNASVSDGDNRNELTKRPGQIAVSYHKQSTSTECGGRWDHSASVVGKKQGEGVLFRVGGQLVEDAFEMLFRLGVTFFQGMEHAH